MNLRSFYCVAALALVGAPPAFEGLTGFGMGAADPAAAAAPATVDRLSAEFKALEEERSRAIAGHDAHFLGQLYADDFRGVGDRGVEVDKARVLALFARFDSSLDFRPDNVRAIPIGRGAAAVRGRLTGRSPQGTIVARSYFLHVYVKRNGRWRMVTGQSTAIPESSHED